MAAINEPTWHELFRGKGVPQSQRQGIILAQQTLAPLQAGIAMAFGDPAGDLVALREGLAKYRRGEPLMCAACEQNLRKDGHSENCEIQRFAQETLTQESFVPNNGELQSQKKILQAKIDKIDKRLSEQERKAASGAVN